MAQTNSDRLQNTFEIWCDNMLDDPAHYAEPALVSCAPFDRLYSEHNISVTTMVDNGKLLVALGHDGAADVIHTQDFNIDADFKPAAQALVNGITNIDDSTIDALYS